MAGTHPSRRFDSDSDQVARLVVAAVDVRLDVVKGEFGAILDGFAAVATGKAVAQINGEALFFANPVHALALAVRAGVTVNHVFAHRFDDVNLFVFPWLAALVMQSGQRETHRATVCS